MSVTDDEAYNDCLRLVKDILTSQTNRHGSKASPAVDTSDAEVDLNDDNDIRQVTQQIRGFKQKVRERGSVRRYKSSLEIGRRKS